VSNTRRGALDGDANGSAGGNYARSFTVGAAPAVRLRLPDVARGPGQALNVPAGTSTGVPVTLSSTDANVTRIGLRLRVDASLFSVTEILRGADLPADATLQVTKVAGVEGQWDVAIASAAGKKLPTGSALRLLSVVGSVPWSAALGSAGAIVLEQVRVNGNDAPLAADAAVQVVAYLGDLNFDGQYTDADYKTVSALASKTLNGLEALDDVDAAIVADVTGDGLLNSLDMAQILLRTKSASTATIPAVPTPPPGTTLAVNLGGSFSNFSLGGSAGSGGTGSSGGSGSSTLSSASLSLTPSLLPSATSQGVPAST
jgi:uncharacterized membrane protein YgcG